MPEKPQQPSGPDNNPGSGGSPRNPGDPGSGAKRWPEQPDNLSEQTGEIPGAARGARPRQGDAESRQVRQPRVGKRESQIRPPERRVEPTHRDTPPAVVEAEPRKRGNGAVWATVGALALLALGAGLWSNQTEDTSTASPTSVPAAGGQTGTDLTGAPAVPTSAPGATTTGAVTTVPEEYLAGLNQPVVDGALQYTVRSVDCSLTELDGRAASRGRWCVAAVTVVNQGTAAATMPPAEQKLMDVQGREYAADAAAAPALGEPGTAVWQPVQPGAEMTGQMAFDMPEDAEPRRLELHNSEGTTGSMVNIS